MRGFIFRRLSAQYTADAVALPVDAINRLTDKRALPSRIDLFFDTNFLLAVLGLVILDNESVTNFSLIIDQIRGNVDLRMYVLPITVDETRRVLRAAMMNYKNFHRRTNLISAASKIPSSGLGKRFFDESSKTGVTAEDFFGPYESDLAAILRSKSIELYNTNLSDLRTDQVVIDDIDRQTKKQAKHRSRGEKPYEANLHDMVLWHFVNRNRKNRPESSHKIRQWIVTMDYGLIAFDNREQLSRVHGLFSCLEPASLVQLLQLWVPSSVDMEETLVNSMRSPLLLLDFDIKSEQVTERILKQLARFEDSKDITEDLAIKIMANSVIRQRISNSQPSTEGDEKIVRVGFTSIIRQNEMRIKKWEEMFTESEANSKLQQSETDSERNRRRELEAEVKREKQERKKIEKQHNLAQSSIDTMRSTVDKLEREKMTLYIAITVLMVIMLLLGGQYILRTWISEIATWVVTISISLSVLLVGSDESLKSSRFKDSIVCRWVSTARRYWWTLIGAVAIAIIAELVTSIL